MAEDEETTCYIAPSASEVIGDDVCAPNPRTPPPLPPFPKAMTPPPPVSKKIPDVNTDKTLPEPLTEQPESIPTNEDPIARNRRLSVAINEQIMVNVASRGIHPEDFPEFVGMGLVNTSSDHFALDSESEEEEEVEAAHVESPHIDPKDRWKKAVRKLNLVRSVSKNTYEETNKRVPKELEEKRQHARLELLASEREYYHRLSVLCDCFMTPLIHFVESEYEKQEATIETVASASSPTLTISKDQIEQVHKVFGNIEQIRDLTKHLLAELAPAIENDGKVGPVFVKVAPYFRMYLSYYQTFDESRIALNDLKMYSWFHCFLAACESQPACDHRCLRDFLIEPVQRVPRYELLIKEILRYTSPDHPFSKELTNALGQVKSVADSMNFELRSSDLRIKVASLSVEWQGVDFTAAHRTFIREGDLIKTNRRGAKVKYRFLLFNDLLAFGAERSTNRFRLHFKAPLRDCLLVDTDHLYSKLGRMPLHDETAPRPKTAVERALMLANAPTRGGPTAAAWKLLQLHGLSTERVLESQIDGHSFLIQAPNHKTLYLTASSRNEQLSWVASISSALIEQTTENRQHKGRRVSMLPSTPIFDKEGDNVSKRSWW